MRNIQTIILAVIAGIMMSGCGLYKKYEREDMQFVDSLYRRMSVPTDSMSSANVSWDKFFTDPLLQDWIQTGLDYNSDLGIARLRVKEAEAALLASRWALLPGADFNMKGGLPGEFSGKLADRHFRRSPKCKAQGSGCPGTERSISSGSADKAGRDNRKQLLHIA